MPLSSSSGPSLGGSSSVGDIAAPRVVRLAMLSASPRPKWAGGRERNIRPKRPLKDAERPDDINPRNGIPCRALIGASYCFQRAVVVGTTSVVFAAADGEPAVGHGHASSVRRDHPVEQRSGGCGAPCFPRLAVASSPAP